MSVFLTVHADVLIANTELRDGLAALKEEQRKESKRLGELVAEYRLMHSITTVSVQDTF